jgi:branched-chain amino acid transport system permease protein
VELYISAIAIWVLIYTLMATGLALQYGFTGLINFGVVGFVAIGAYGSGILSQHGVPVWLSIPAGAVLAALAAYPLGRITLRLGGDYLAIVTLGFSETVRIFIIKEEWLTRGTHGMPGLPRIFEDWAGRSSGDLTLLVLLVAVNVVIFLLMWGLIRSPFGRILAAVRDNEVAAKALGKDTASFKTRALMIGSALCGLGGAFQAHYITFIGPEQYVPLMTFYVWIAIMIGGAVSIRGIVFGTIILIGFLEGSRFLRDVFGGISEVQLASVRFWLIGMALICTVLYRPQGLFGERTKGTG